jgi:hypothetical protein
MSLLHAALRDTLRRRLEPLDERIYRAAGADYSPRLF